MILVRAAAAEFFVIHDCCDHNLEKQVSASPDMNITENPREKPSS